MGAGVRARLLVPGWTPSVCGRGGDGPSQGLPKSIRVLTACSWCRPLMGGSPTRFGISERVQNGPVLTRTRLKTRTPNDLAQAPELAAAPGLDLVVVQSEEGLDGGQDLAPLFLHPPPARLRVEALAHCLQLDAALGTHRG